MSAALGSFLAAAPSRDTAPVSGQVTQHRPVKARVMAVVHQRGPDPITSEVIGAYLPTLSRKQVDNAVRALRRRGLLTVAGKVLSASGREVSTYRVATSRDHTGVELIRQEREAQQRQYTDSHDDRHRRQGELADAAACLLLELTQGPGRAVDDELGPPDSWVSRLALRLRGASRVRRLQVIGALVAAEMDRERRKGDS